MYDETLILLLNAVSGKLNTTSLNSIQDPALSKLNLNSELKRLFSSGLLTTSKANADILPALATDQLNQLKKKKRVASKAQLLTTLTPNELNKSLNAYVFIPTAQGTKVLHRAHYFLLAHKYRLDQFLHFDDLMTVQAQTDDYIFLQNNVNQLFDQFAHLGDWQTAVHLLERMIRITRDYHDATSAQTALVSISLLILAFDKEENYTPIFDQYLHTLQTETHENTESLDNISEVITNSGTDIQQAFGLNNMPVVQEQLFTLIRSGASLSDNSKSVPPIQP